MVVTSAAYIVALSPIEKSSSKHTSEIVVSSGSSASGIALLLKENNLIRSKFAFLISCRFSGKSDKLKPGTYRISNDLSTSQIINLLVAGTQEEKKITVPEGFNVRQLADILEKQELVDGDSFVRVVLNNAKKFPDYIFLYGPSMEGYLFPDTYLLSKNMTSDDIIIKMLDAFQSKVFKPHQREIKDAIKKRFNVDSDDVSQYSEGFHKIIILASLVEREAKKSSDRPLIAAVLWNRLSIRMRLEICATVDYIPGQTRGNKKKVYIKDTQRDTPYNTYRIYGLPPGPICNPSLASILAVIKPAQVNYLYYVAKADGGHVFSTTYSQHLAAKNALRSETP